MFVMMLFWMKPFYVPVAIYLTYNHNKLKGSKAEHGPTFWMDTNTCAEK